jgi:dienelactone hydrolase
VTRLPLALVTTALLGGALAGPALGDPVGPEDLPAVAGEYAESRQRGSDQLAHPEFRARVAPYERASAAAFLAARADPSSTALEEDGLKGVYVDPYREAWTGGVSLRFPLRTRYGALLDGTLYAPPADRRGRFPAVVYVAGGGTSDHAAQGLGQTLAEHGYVVWTITAHDSAGNAATPPDPDPATPEHELCAPGPWQEPQELGIRETGPCAGQVPPPGELTPESAAALAGIVAGAYAGESGEAISTFPAAYETVRAVRVFPAFDAADQLLSDANPLLDRVDRKRLGLVGWSLGAHAAVIVGNADERFSAVVSHDGFGLLQSTTSPRVPTLFLHHDLRNEAVRLHDVDLEVLPGARDARRFAAAGVPTGLVVPRASRHTSFVQVNYAAQWAGAAALGYPDAVLGGVDSPRDSERVVLHYTRAWLDRFLAARTGKDRRAADAVLTAAVFDPSTDRSSIGQGTWDPARGNVPYAIGGERTADHLSPHGASWVSLPGGDCPDLRRGC